MNDTTTKVSNTATGVFSEISLVAFADNIGKAVTKNSKFTSAQNWINFLEKKSHLKSMKLY